MSYNIKTVQLNAAADSRMLGVRLGRMAIQHNIPVSIVADELGVTRAVVYNWILGKHDVGKHLYEKVLAYYNTLIPKSRR